MNRASRNRRMDIAKTPPVSRLVRTLLLCLMILCGHSALAFAWTRSDSEALIGRMQAAYDRVTDYQAHLLISGFGKDSDFSGVQKIVYTFKKPNKVRVDFESPHRGMVILYPDRDGRAVVIPSKRFPGFAFHVAPDSPLMEISPGQHINQTDLGMLIRNISHSLTDLFLGELDVKEDSEKSVLEVLSENPFRKSTPTRYAFTIDKRLWLPVAVDESSPGGTLRRRVLYKDFKLNVETDERVFQSD